MMNLFDIVILRWFKTFRQEVLLQEKSKGKSIRPVALRSDCGRIVGRIVGRIDGRIDFPAAVRPVRIPLYGDFHYSFDDFTEAFTIHSMTLRSLALFEDFTEAFAV